MKKAARVSALVIMPLAAAVNAHAGAITYPVLPAGNPTCSTNDSGLNSSCSGGAFNFGINPSGLTGVGLFTSGGFVSFHSGGTAILTLTASGPLIGGPLNNGQIIPLQYDFSLAAQNGGDGLTVSSWDLDFQLLDGQTVIGDSGDITGSPSDPSLSGGYFVSDASSMTLTGGAMLGDTLTEQVMLSVDWSAGDSDSLQVNVPAVSSFDYNSGNITSSNVPEPGTMGFMASAFALAGFVLWRRKKGYTLVRTSR